MKKSCNRSGPQWNAYCEAGEGLAGRRDRLAEVPESLRAGVESHLRTVFAVRRAATDTDPGRTQV